MRARNAWMLFGVALFSVTACDCTDEGEKVKTLTILSPEHGAILTRLDDEDPASESTIELTVEVEGERLEVGEEVSLFPNAETADTDEPIATAEVGDDGMVVFSAVSFATGDYALQARTSSGSVQSNTVRISVTTACAATRFVVPMPPPSTRLTLGPADDEDGDACGDEFHTTFTVATDAGDGQEARLFVNGTLRATVTVAGTVATFPGVHLDRVGSTPNTVEVEVDSEFGTCRETFPAEVYVDCDGVTCSIESPTGGFLGMDDDTSDAEGFQTDFTVLSDSEAVGNPVFLIVDGDESGAREVTATMDGSGAEARFGNIPLSEGTHTVRAVCTDAAGNRTPSGEVTYTVDITPCGVSISSPADGEVFIDADDLDTSTDGIQIAAAGSASGTDCEEFRVGVCPSISGATFSALSDDSFSGELTLGSGATQEVCAQVTDQAGNIGEARVTIGVESDAPQLEIASPSDGDAYNQLGTAGRTADLDPGSTSSCEAAFEVYCTEVGRSVTLHRSGVSAPLTGGTADCVADGTVPSPYAGRATFASVSLPSIDSGAVLNVTARQEGDRLVGVSAAVGLFSDCNPPVLTVNRPTCESILRPTTDDENLAAGFQYEVRIFNNNDPKPPVDLEIRDSGGSLVYSATSSLPAAPSLLTNFPDADFGSGGVLEIIACATDAAGGVGCAPSCEVTVADLPTLTITTPTMLDVVTEADDCGGAAGLQVQVVASTDAAEGSDATVQIGSATVVDTTVSAGTISVCTDATDGRDVPIRVTVTDASRGMSSAMVTVDIDTMAPTDPIDDLSITAVDRRGGVIGFQWEAVEDAGGFLLESYLLRCSDSEITNESEWSSATPITITHVPASATTVQSENITGFRIGVPRYCTLRGMDAAGRLTPLGNTPDAMLPFEAREVTASSAIQFGYSVAAVGDVNGDGIDDVLIGAPSFASGVTGDSQAYLYFGSAAGLSATPGVRFIGRNFTFGIEVHGLGDFNGDGLSDFAIAERGRDGAQGAVYVMFGRSAGSPWAATLDLSAGCAADVCFVASGGSGAVTFGWGLGSADFNGDGLMDLVVGAAQANRLYVLLGSDAFVSGSEFDIPATTTITPDSSQPAGFYYDGGASVAGLGRAVISFGHFTGGGEHDVVVSANGTTTPSSVDGAVLYLAGRPYPGSAEGLQQIPTAEGTTLDTGTPATFGVFLGTTDYDGNGEPDLVVYLDTSAGQVFVYPNNGGFSAATRLTFTNDAAGSSSDRFGVSLAHGSHAWLGNLGGIDAVDTRQELLVGSAQHSTDVGSVALFFGRSPAAGRARSGADILFHPAAAGGDSGIRVGAFIGDVNGDGFNDLAVGDRFAYTRSGRMIIQY